MDDGNCGCNECMSGSTLQEKIVDHITSGGMYGGRTFTPPVMYVPNTTDSLDITTGIKHKLDYYDSSKHPPHLRKHQYIVNQFMRRDLTANIPRGLLLFHPMGTGKTITFVSLAVTLNRPVIAVMPKALVENARHGIKQYCKYNRADYDTVIGMFTFISLDAYNMISEIERVTNGDLNGYTVIVDEAHELFTQICNGNNKNGPTFYNMVMNAVDIFIIFATGTPIEKDPYEIVPMANMLTGQIIFPHDYKEFVNMYVGRAWNSIEDVDDAISGGADKISAVPEALADKSPEVFTAENPAPENYIMPNRWLLQNRLVGIISHTIANKDRFPRELPLRVNYIPMHGMQWSVYTGARDTEKREAARAMKPGKPGAKRFGQNGVGRAQKTTRSTFRQQSRTLCNVYSDNTTGISYSPKFDRIAADMTSWRRKTVAYSQFKENGINELARRLLALGWVNIDETQSFVNGGHVSRYGGYGPPPDLSAALSYGGRESPPDTCDNAKDNDDEDTIGEDDDEEFEADPIVDDSPEPVIAVNAMHLGPNDKLYFAVLSGDSDQNYRKRVVNMFNDMENNVYGHTLCAVLVSRVGSRGINFIGGREVVACESYWTYARFRQLNGRIRRDGSHLHLPYEDRTTQFHIYLSDPPPEKIGSEEVAQMDDPEDGSTSDTVIYNRALKRQYMLDSFMDAMKEVSIECPNLKRITGYDPVDSNGAPITCYQCQGANKERLYTLNGYEDLRKGNPCHKVVEKKLDLLKITIAGESFMYSKEAEVYGKSIYKMAIYHFDTKIERYRRMPENDARFLDVYRAIEVA